MITAATICATACAVAMPTKKELDAARPTVTALTADTLKNIEAGKLKPGEGADELLSFIVKGADEAECFLIANGALRLQMRSGNANGVWRMLAFFKDAFYLSEEELVDLLDEERPGAEAWIKTGMANPTREQLATAVANSLKDRGSRACISNLKQLQTACEQARLEGIKNPKMTDLIGRDRYIVKMPRCPSGGVYSLPTDGSGVPTCSCGRDSSLHRLGRDKAQIQEYARLNEYAEHVHRFHAKTHQLICISNLKQLQTACEQARLEGIKNPKMTDLIGRDKYIAKMPRCPSGGVYSLPTDGSGVPTCSCCTSDKFPHKLEGHATNTACQENKARPVDHKKLQHNRLQRQHNQAVCISNLKQLQAACEQARLSGIEQPTMKDLIGEDKYIKNMPVCPCGGTYSLPEDDDSEATCSHNDPQCPHKVTLSAD